jgi:DnaJ like chaperone protein
MSIWGKLAGAAAGLAVGGPIGALVGGVAGHYAIDRGQEEEGPAENQVAFTVGVIALGAKMAKADGVVTKDEIGAFKEVFHIPQEEMQNVGRLFNQARRDASGFEPYARQIARLFRHNPAVLEELLDGLFHIARADRKITPDEVEYLAKVAEIFGFDEDDWARIRASNMGPDSSDPYEVLGVSHQASDAEIKAAHRRLVIENHPDKLVAEGLPQEFVDLANQKLATINAAYDRIRARRKQT